MKPDDDVTKPVYIRRRTLLAIVGAVALTFIATMITRSVWFPGRAFDSVAWNDPAQVREGVRLEMADRLIARHTLIGKSRTEVVEMLGEPPPTSYFTEWELVYWLGPERGSLSVDSEWLVLKLGDTGRVVENRIARD